MILKWATWKVPEDSQYKYKKWNLNPEVAKLLRFSKHFL